MVLVEAVKLTFCALDYLLLILNPLLNLSFKEIKLITLSFQLSMLLLKTFNLLDQVCNLLLRVLLHNLVAHESTLWLASTTHDSGRLNDLSGESHYSEGLALL